MPEKQRRKIIISTGTHWDRIINCGEELCFVCDKKFKKKKEKLLIGFHPQTNDPLYRHRYCEYGSVNWYNKFGGREPIKKKKKTEEDLLLNANEFGIIRVKIPVEIIKTKVRRKIIL